MVSTSAHEKSFLNWQQIVRSQFDAQSEGASTGQQLPAPVNRNHPSQDASGRSTIGSWVTQRLSGSSGTAKRSSFTAMDTSALHDRADVSRRPTTYERSDWSDLSSRRVPTIESSSLLSLGRSKRLPRSGIRLLHPCRYLRRKWIGALIHRGFLRWEKRDLGCKKWRYRRGSSSW